METGDPKYQHLEIRSVFFELGGNSNSFSFVPFVRSTLGDPVGSPSPVFGGLDPWCSQRVLFGLFGFDFFCNFYLLWCLWCFCCFGHKVSKLRFQALHNLAGIHILPRCMWSVKQGDSNWKSNRKLTGNLIATSPRRLTTWRALGKKLPSTKSVKTNWDGLKHLHDSQNSTYQLVFRIIFCLKSPGRVPVANPHQPKRMKLPKYFWGFEDSARL